MICLNVIISNKQQNQLSKLDIDVIKNISGVYQVNELVEMFKNFFYNRMILDVTAISGYTDISKFKIIAKELDVEKIIFLLPDGSRLCTSSFLSDLISMGIYNFTTNIDGVKYLLKKVNKYEDVAHIQKQAQKEVKADNENIGQNVVVSDVNSSKGPRIIGVRNATDNAGATTFIYMLKSELQKSGFNVISIELDKNDFQYFNDKTMLSITTNNLQNTIKQHASVDVIFIDINNLKDLSICSDVYYLLEPSIIKLNKLVKMHRYLLEKLRGKKVILNKSLLSNGDISDFEKESGLKIIFNMPPLDERKRNPIIRDFLINAGVLSQGTSQPGNENSRIFGLFRL